MAIELPGEALHLCSCYSFGYGVLTPERICDGLKMRGYRAAALVDRRNFFGMPRFIRAATTRGIKPIVGMSLWRGGERACTAYVLEHRGFATLNRLASEPEGSDPLRRLLQDGWEGLALMSQDPEVLRILLQAGRRNLYVQLSHRSASLQQISFARSTDLPYVAADPVLYIGEDQVEAGNLLRSVLSCRRLDEMPRRFRLQSAERLAGPEQTARRYAAVPQALISARDLAERACSAEQLLPQTWVFPRYLDLSEERSFSLLKRLCFRRAVSIFGQGAPLPCAPDACAGGEEGPGGEGERTGSAGAPAQSEWRARLRHELGVIRRSGFAGYFLVVRDIVRSCSASCGRGSSAASLVSFLLGITHVDPMRYRLDFHRFLNEHRAVPPDIDVDFPWDERGRVLHSVFARFPGRSAMIADHVRFGPRSAMREAAKAYGLCETEIGKMVNWYAGGRRKRIPPYLLSGAQALVGLPRHLGTHCGGVVITPEPITNYTHLRISPAGYPVIAWDRGGAEAAHLVKIDLLGNRSLAVLRDSLASLRGRGRAGSRPGSEAVGFAELERPALPERAAVLRDGETRRMIARGDTLGLFYVESPASRQLLRRMGRGDYEHLIMAGSIIRPAANRLTRLFLKRLRGAPYRCLSPALQHSYGVMVYQEDLARVTAEAAGFAPAATERLRRVLAGSNGQAELEHFRRMFFTGGARRGKHAHDLEVLWRMICTFRGYSFCKAHSASYALLAFKLAYVKRHDPAHFFVAVINNGGGYYSRQTYLNECRRRGLAVLGPDVNASDMRYSFEGGGIRVGLGQLRSIREKFLHRLLVERERGGPFTDFAQFCRRLGPSLTETRILVRCGALDGIAGEMNRPRLLWYYLRRGSTEGLFPPQPPPLPDYPLQLKALDELRTLGLMISWHPVRLFRGCAQRQAVGLGLPPLLPSSEIEMHAGREISLVGMVASGKEVITRGARPGASMVFLTLEDEFSLFESVLLPSVFERCRDRIDGGGVLLLSGRVEPDAGACVLRVRRLARITGGRE